MSYSDSKAVVIEKNGVRFSHFHNTFITFTYEGKSFTLIN